MTAADLIALERAHFDADYRQPWNAGLYPPTLPAFLATFHARSEVPYWRAGVCQRSDVRHATLRAARPSGDWRGVRVLEIGCGMGEAAMALAARGADATGCDLSAVAIQQAREAAGRYGLAVRFDATDSMPLPYASASFDVVVGFGVLHHLIKYPPIAAELRRVLRPDGRAVFQESWWENPLLNRLRHRYTMVEEEAGDAELTWATLRAWTGGTFTARVQHYSLLYAAKRLTREQHVPGWQRAGLALAAGVDAVLRRTPGLQRLGAEAVVVLRPAHR